MNKGERLEDLRVALKVAMPDLLNRLPGEVQQTNNHIIIRVFLIILALTQLSPIARYCNNKSGSRFELLLN